jgi:hypothetical protein
MERRVVTDRNQSTRWPLSVSGSSAWGRCEDYAECLGSVAHGRPGLAGRLFAAICDAEFMSWVSAAIPAFLIAWFDVVERLEPVAGA